MTGDSEKWKKRAVAQLDSVVSFSEDDRLFGILGGYGRTLDERSQSVAELETRCMAAIFDVAPAGSPYRSRAVQLSRSGAVLGGNPDRYDDIVSPMVGIVKALLNNVKQGFLTEVGEEIRSGYSADILTLAEDILAEGPKFKDPAAVIGTVVLEEHLRRLATKFDVPVEEDGKHRSADSLNADLAKKGAYNKAYQKSVTGWLQIRNDSHHADWGKYDAPQVQHMLSAVGDFIAGHPA